MNTSGRQLVFLVMYRALGLTTYTTTDFFETSVEKSEAWARQCAIDRLGALKKITPNGTWKIVRRPTGRYNSTVGSVA